MIGNFFRSGKLYTQEPIRVNDHDFVSNSDGKVAPHGLYDIYRNIGYYGGPQSQDKNPPSLSCALNFHFI